MTASIYGSDLTNNERELIEPYLCHRSPTLAALRDAASRHARARDSPRSAALRQRRDAGLAAAARKLSRRRGAAQLETYVADVARGAVPTAEAIALTTLVPKTAVWAESLRRLMGAFLVAAFRRKRLRCAAEAAETSFAGL